jgi:glycosyltransferase 2 family protein
MQTSLPAETTTAADASGLRLVLPAVACIAATWVLWRFTASATPAPPRVVLAAVPLYLGLWLATIALHAWRWRLVLRRLGNDVPLPRLMRLWLAARAVGSVIPSGTLGGEPVRVQMLTAAGMSAASATGAVALDRALELAGNTIVGPLCVAAAFALGAGSGAGMWAVALGGLAGLATLIRIYLLARRGRPALRRLADPPSRLLPARWRIWVHQGAERADAALQEILTAHPGLVPAGIGVSLVIEGLHLVELAALFAVFAIAVPLPLLLLSSLGIGVAHAVPVTAALGTLEATQVGLFTVGGEPLATGLAVAMALRLAETLAILSGLACLATAGHRRARSARPEC